jgi:hypothetical protein
MSTSKRFCSGRSGLRPPSERPERAARALPLRHDALAAEVAAIGHSRGTGARIAGGLGGVVAVAERVHGESRKGRRAEGWRSSSALKSDIGPILDPRGSHRAKLLILWRSLGDSNPCFRRERAKILVTNPSYSGETGFKLTGVAQVIELA